MEISSCTFSTHCTCMPTTLAGQLPVSVKLVHEEAFEVVKMLRSQSLLNLLDDKQSLH